MSAVDAALLAAREAGDCLTGYFGKLDPSWVSEKAQNDLVSRADKESEEICRRVLLSAFPGDRFLGEETGASAAGDDAPAWIVDPLDGTANFIRGFPHWCVSIARTERGLAGPLTVGVVWDPVKDDLFVCERGAGAFRNGARITVPACPGLEAAAVATGFPFRNRAKIDQYLSIFKQVFLEVRSLRRAGSAALDLAYTAAGIFDGFFEFGLSPWDTAAGALLVTEAGGIVSDFDGKQGWRTRGNVLAGTPGVHAALAALVARAGVTEDRL